MNIYITSCTKLLVRSGYIGKETVPINRDIKDKGEKNSKAVLTGNLIFKGIFLLLLFVHFLFNISFTGYVKNKIPKQAVCNLFIAMHANTLLCHFQFSADFSL